MKVETKLFIVRRDLLRPGRRALRRSGATGTSRSGRSASSSTAALCGLIGFYLTVTGRRIDPRPEDNPNALISEQAGDYGFFTPYSLVAAVARADRARSCFLGLAVGWWLFIIGRVRSSAIVWRSSPARHAHLSTDHGASTPTDPDATASGRLHFGRAHGPSACGAIVSWSAELRGVIDRPAELVASALRRSMPEAVGCRWDRRCTDACQPVVSLVRAVAASRARGRSHEPRSSGAGLEDR